jgi:multiple sugar transport system ATP-binding protein
LLKERCVRWPGSPRNRLVKRYGNFQAVHGIDFDIADGEFVAILGPSGCGKSSTMRMIAGLESVSERADSLFDGHAGERPVRARDRNVAMSFENYALYAPISVYENIAFPLRSAGVEAGARSTVRCGRWRRRWS